MICQMLFRYTIQTNSKVHNLVEIQINSYSKCWFYWYQNSVIGFEYYESKCDYFDLTAETENGEPLPLSFRTNEYLVVRLANYNNRLGGLTIIMLVNYCPFAIRWIPIILLCLWLRPRVFMYLIIKLIFFNYTYRVK